MRHRKKTIKLSRVTASRRALLKNLAESLLLSEKIKTTEAKAKAVKPFVERLISRSKSNDLATRRYLLQNLTKIDLVNKLLAVIGPKYQDRQGGYTRIVKLGQRPGDGAKMAVIELV